MKRLSKEQILMLHLQLIEQTGGTTGVRDFRSYFLSFGDGARLDIMNKPQMEKYTIS